VREQYGERFSERNYSVVRETDSRGLRARTVADSTANTDTALGTPLGLTLEEVAALVTANFSLFAVRLRLAKMASELRSGDVARPCSLVA